MEDSSGQCREVYVMELNRNILRNLPIALRIGIEENARRKELTQSELAAEQKRILDELRKHKKPGARTDLTSEKGFSEVRATTVVGKLFNESHKTVEKRLAIVDAAKAEREKYGKLLEDMDRTGRVHGVFKQLKVQRQAEALRKEPPPLPGRGPYRVMAADPPWKGEVRAEDPSHRINTPYPPMSVEEICDLPVAALAAPDCILWLWVTNHQLLNGDALKVLTAWGFTGKTMRTWVKHKMGTGDWLRGQTEHVIMAVRGKPVVELTNQTTVFYGKARGHSVKPVEFYDFVEKLCPASRYAYWFSRYQHNEKWDCHGDEAPCMSEAAE
jgi:N6-adenosine-specific RNA methylase IME4